MLKDVSYVVGLAWKKIIRTTIITCWKKCISKKDLKAACAAHGSNLEAYDPFAWIDVDGETRLRCISVKRRSQLL